MTNLSFTEVCVTLGLLGRNQADQLQSLAPRAERYQAEQAIIQLALQKGLLDEEAVARALAQQYRLNMVPSDRIQKLKISPKILELLPASLMRTHFLMPTFLDEENRILSVLTWDPGNVAVLREVQVVSKAARLRLFVATQSAIQELVQRLLPEVPTPALPALPRQSVVYEPARHIASLITQLANEEGASVQVISTVPELEGLLTAERVGQVWTRSGVQSSVEALVTAAGIPMTSVLAWGPWAGPMERTSELFFNLLELTLQNSESQAQYARMHTRRMVWLTRELVGELGLSVSVREATLTATLLLELQAGGQGVVGALQQLEQLGGNVMVAAVLRTLQERSSGQESPGRNLGTEVIYTASACVRLKIMEGDDPLQALGKESARHDGRVLKALTAILKRGSRTVGSQQLPTVILAERDGALLANLESRLTESGFRVMTVGDGEQVLALAKSRPPVAIVAAIRLTRKDGIAMLVELKRDATLCSIPVVLLGDLPVDVARGLDLGAEDVLVRPVSAEVLLARLRRILDRRQSLGSAGIMGRIQDLPLVDLLQTLMMGGRTAWIRLATSNEEGAIQLRNGQLVAAVIGDLLGEEALFAQVDLDDGRFEVYFEDRGQANLYGSSEFMLLEAVRRRDERRGR